MSNSSNEMKNMLRKMRNVKNGIKTPNVVEIQKKDISMRDMLKITRNYNKKNTSINNSKGFLNENDTLGSKKTTIHDQKKEEEKFLNYFNDNQVDINFINLEVFDNGVFWGGTIDGELQWVYKVTPDETTSGFEINYLEGFDKGDPENIDIIKKLEAYYDEFYKYWRDNELQ